jgi:hypothetical protein
LTIVTADGSVISLSLPLHDEEMENKCGSTQTPPHAWQGFRFVSFPWRTIELTSAPDECTCGGGFLARQPGGDGVLQGAATLLSSHAARSFRPDADKRMNAEAARTL